MRNKFLFFIILFLSFIFINNKACFCADYPTINLEQSEQIFNFLLNVSKRSSTDLKNNINSSTPTAFMKYFNENIAPKFYNATNGECDSSNHFICLANNFSVYFFVTNATLSNNLDFVKIYATQYDNEYDVSSSYALYMNFFGNNSFGSNEVERRFVDLPLFYSNNVSTFTPSYDKDMTTLLTPNLFYLGQKPLSDVSFRAYGSDAYSWYFLEHCFVPPSSGGGDTGGGSTSGDTPSSGDSSSNDYSGQLSDINGNILGVKDNLVTLNGKIATSGDIQNIMNNFESKLPSAVQGGLNNYFGSSGDLTVDNFSTELSR